MTRRGLVLLLLATVVLAVTGGTAGGVTRSSTGPALSSSPAARTASTVTLSGAAAGTTAVSGGPVCAEKNGSVLGVLHSGLQISIGWLDYPLKAMSFPSHSKAVYLEVNIAYGDSIGDVEWRANATTGKGTVKVSGSSKKPRFTVNVKLVEVRPIAAPAPKGPLTVKGTWSC